MPRIRPVKSHFLGKKSGALGATSKFQRVHYQSIKGASLAQRKKFGRPFGLSLARMRDVLVKISHEKGDNRPRQELDFFTRYFCEPQTRKLFRRYGLLENVDVEDITRIVYGVFSHHPIHSAVRRRALASLLTRVQHERAEMKQFSQVKIYELSFAFEQLVGAGEAAYDVRHYIKDIRSNADSRLLIFEVAIEKLLRDSRESDRQLGQ